MPYFKPNHTSKGLKTAMEKGIVARWYPEFSCILPQDQKQMFLGRIQILKIGRIYAKVVFLDHDPTRIRKAHKKSILLPSHKKYKEILALNCIKETETIAMLTQEKPITIPTLRPRDFQKRKCYQFGWHLKPKSQKFKNKNEIKLYVEMILNTLKIRESYIVEFYGTTTSNYRRRDNRIRISPEGANEITILHELAHWFTPEEFSCHGEEFMRNFAFMLNYFSGIDWNTIYKLGQYYKVKIAPETYLSEYLKPISNNFNNILDRYENM